MPFFIINAIMEVNAMDDGGNSRTIEGLRMAAVNMSVAVI